MIAERDLTLYAANLPKLKATGVKREELFRRTQKIYDEKGPVKFTEVLGNREGRGHRASPRREGGAVPRSQSLIRLYRERSDRGGELVREKGMTSGVSVL